MFFSVLGYEIYHGNISVWGDNVQCGLLRRIILSKLQVLWFSPGIFGILQQKTPSQAPMPAEFDHSMCTLVQKAV